MKRLSVCLVVLASSAATPRSLSAQIEPSRESAQPLRQLVRYEPTGLSLLQPYVAGKIPVVFVHGLWSSPWSWSRMVEALEDDPVIADRFQLWTFGYSTGDPFPYSAFLLRKDLDDARMKLDPGRADPAFERMVIVGHSMGGLVSKMISVKSGDRLWKLVSDRPISEIKGDERDINLFRRGLIFDPYPGISRVVYIATPHRGSRFDRGLIERVGTRLVRIQDPLRAAHDRLVAGNPPDFFRERFRKGIPSSIDELEWGSPILTGLAELSNSPTMSVHSIIAVRRASSAAIRTDGLVSYESAHIEGARSEKIVTAGHLCQDHPDVIGEVRRILLEHARRLER